MRRFPGEEKGGVWHANIDRILEIPDDTKTQEEATIGYYWLLLAIIINIII